NVQREIEERADAVGFSAMRRAAEAMSQAYRAGRSANLADEASVAAYLVTRMPATYAAVHRVLRELPASVGSVLDVGAGTGAASLAARAYFPNASVTMIERHQVLIDVARVWLPDSALANSISPHDLVIASYSFGEMGGKIERLWAAARIAL